MYLNRSIIFLGLLGALCAAMGWPLFALAQSSATRSGQTPHYALFTPAKVAVNREAPLALDMQQLELDMPLLEALLKQQPANMRLSLYYKGAEVLVEMAKVDLLTGDFLMVGSQSPSESRSIMHGLHYQGHLVAQPGQIVALSFFPTEVNGLIQGIGGDNLVLSKLEGATTMHTIFAEKDLNLPTPTFYCGTTEEQGVIPKERVASTRSAMSKCVRMYVEGDYTLFTNKGGVQGATNYLLGAFNQVSALYARESVTLTVSQVFIWETQDSYDPNGGSNALNQFGAARPTFNGDLAHLVSIRTNSFNGIAWLDGLCSRTAKYGYSQIANTYASIPTYSWTVNVLAHEIGHNLGSPHTHACSWAGGPLDNCVPPEGNCAPGPAPVGGGTIMSYCNQTSAGIDFNKGFGQQPGDLIRQRVNAATCLQTCTPTGSLVESEYFAGDFNLTPSVRNSYIGVRRGSDILKDTDYQGGHEIGYPFGLGDQETQYLIGDWDGDGRDNVAVRRGNLILMDTDFNGSPNRSQTFGGGSTESEYLAGDWDGDGDDNIGVRRGADILMDTNGSGGHEIGYPFGNGTTDRYLVGDWDGNGTDNIGVRRGNIVLMDLGNGGAAERQIQFGGGDSECQYLVGDWDGDGDDELAVRRANVIFMDFGNGGSAERVQSFGLGTANCPAQATGSAPVETREEPVEMAQIAPAVFAYPTPVVDVLTLAMGEIPTAPVQVQLFDINGQMVKQMVVTEQVTQHFLGDIRPGVYFLKIFDPNHRSPRVAKVLKQ